MTNLLENGLIIVGEPGSGKSSLAHFIAAAHGTYNIINCFRFTDSKFNDYLDYPVVIVEECNIAHLESIESFMKSTHVELNELAKPPRIIKRPNMIFVMTGDDSISTSIPVLSPVDVLRRLA